MHWKKWIGTKKSNNMPKLKLPVGDRDHFLGDANAFVTLLEYGDYQCPHCGHAYPIIKDIQEKLGDSLKFVYRNFPLQEAHPHALHAAIASEDAALQRKFWEMHDMLFENQEKLEDAYLLQYANMLKLDVTKFENDFSEHVLAKKVSEDFESGVRSGVNGTPTFFINGEKYDGNWADGSLLEKLRAELKK